MKKRPLDLSNPNLRKVAEDLLAGKYVQTAQFDVHDLQILLHELSVYQVELQLQNEELLHSQQQLQKSYTDYNKLYEFAPVAYLCLDEHGQIQRFNKRFSDWIGTNRRTIIGLSITKFIAPEYLLLWNAWFYSPQRCNTPCDFALKTPTNATRYVSAHVSEQISPHGELMPMIALSDISALKNAEEQVELAATVFEASHEGFMIVDSNLQIKLVNQAFTRITGYTKQEVIGQSPNILKSSRHSEVFYRELWYMLNKHNHWEGEIWNKHKDGTIRPYWLSMTVTRNARGQARRYIGLYQDISERKKAEATLIEANRAKSDFLANMSHELRTPMNGVIGLLDVLQQTDLGKDQRNMVNTIQESSLALLNILNDILDFSKIEAGKLQFEFVATPLAETLESTTQLVLSLADAKAIQLDLFIAPELPSWIETDPSRLRQILLNLASNAVKFTSNNGNVQICAEACPAQSAWQIRVIDNGIGMSEATQNKLFSPFTQADESTSRKFGGTGLGLSITRRLVEMMGGTITVHSELNRGSEFTVTLPLKAANPIRSTLTQPNLSDIHIICVSNSTLYAEWITRYCHAAGASVSKLADVTQALQTISNIPAQKTVLLLDCHINTNSELIPPNTVQLVPRDQHQHQGISVCSQPLFYTELISALHLATHAQVSSNSAQPRIERRKTQRLAAPTIEQALAENSLILLAEDNPTNRAVITEQLRLLGYTAETAEDGAIALAMWKTGRYALVLTDCHMPNMDGFELTQAIRDSNKNIPIIAVTANALQGIVERCLEQGMNGYLCKPLRLNELSKILHKWLPRSSSNTVIPKLDAISVNSTENSALALWDRSILTQMIGDNPDMQRELLAEFIGYLQEHFATINTALSKQDCLSAGKVAHTLKSASRTVGAIQLGELCRQIETAAKTNDLVTCLAQQQPLQLAITAIEAEITGYLK